MLSRYQYGVPTTFTFQPNPVPHRELTPGQQLNYDEQAATHGPRPDTLGDYARRLLDRAAILPVLFPAAPISGAPVLSCLRCGNGALPGLLWHSGLRPGNNFYPYFYPHYIAAATCLFVLVSVTGLQRLSLLTIHSSPPGAKPPGARVSLRGAVPLLVRFSPLRRYHASAAMLPYDTWDDVNHGDPLGRIAVRDRLAQAPGKQLVVVRYWPSTAFKSGCKTPPISTGPR